MRRMFKYYQKVKIWEIDADPTILDLRTLEQAPTVETAYLIPAAHLKEIFGRFIQGRVNDTTTIGDAKVFSLKALPGRRIGCFLLFSSQCISKTTVLIHVL